MQYETHDYLTVNAIFKDLAFLLSDIIFYPSQYVH
jgi:hypothetical protein